MLIGIFDQKGPQSDCLRCEVCQNLILSPMNTGLLRHAVATVLTVYGIETRYVQGDTSYQRFKVATVLTVYGIETTSKIEPFLASNFLYVATVLTVYGIETLKEGQIWTDKDTEVATVLTVYGIETHGWYSVLHFELQLQQSLPFTVLKHTIEGVEYATIAMFALQQSLPFTVLKLIKK